EELPADRGGSLEHRDLFATVEAAQVVAEFARRREARAHRGPVRDQVLEDHGATRGKNLFAKRLEIDAAPFQYLRHKGGTMLQRTASRQAWVLCAAWFAASRLYAADAPLMDALFTDHLVLQRDRPIPIWGHAAAGEEVTVTLSGATRSVRANADGRWALTMPELPAGGPHTLTARTANRMTNAHDVLVGDVWLCSGQSNMEFSVRGALNSRAEIAASANDGIRQVRIPHASSTTPRDGFDAPLEWKVAGPDTTADFSAVCYFYARDLAQSNQAPQGLVVAAWGGSKIQPWMSEAALRSLGGSETVLDIAAKYRTNAAAGIEKWGEYWKA